MMKVENLSLDLVIEPVALRVYAPDGLDNGGYIVGTINGLECLSIELSGRQLIALQRSFAAVESEAAQ